MVAAVTILVVLAAFMVRFRNIIGPLLLAFILAYLLHPMISRLQGSTHLSWRASVNVTFLVMVVILVALSSLIGLAMIDQLQNLVSFVQRSLVNLPTLLEELTETTITLGPFTFDLSQYLTLDLNALSEQLLATLQPILARLGNLIGTFAASAVVTLGWGLFILLVSYFLLADAGRDFPEAFLGVEVPGYQDDIRRMGHELGRIWNAFMRGQLILFAVAVVTTAVFMSALGVRFALGLAILAGFARFIPYVGPLTTWTVTFLVAFFQEGNYLGLTSLQYAVIVVVVVVLLDQVFDNLVTPRLLGQTLGVHPAAVLVAAIVATQLIGIIGLLLAAPVLATLQLIGRYTLRKMFDLDPWPETAEQPREFAWMRELRTRFQKWRVQRRGGSEDVEGNI